MSHRCFFLSKVTRFCPSSYHLTTACDDVQPQGFRCDNLPVKPLHIGSKHAQGWLSTSAFCHFHFSPCPEHDGEYICAMHLDKWWLPARSDN